MARIGWGRILAGVAAAAAAGAAYVYIKQRGARAPLHETLETDGAFEIRRYPALLMLETVQQGSRDRALGNGFGLLADYMFGEGREGDEIPIVMPVFGEALAGDAWKIRFLLPAAIDPAGLTPPAHGIVIVERPARDVAVVHVPGRPSDKLFARREAELRNWMEARGLEPAGPVEHAYYNSPLKPGTAHPNALLIPIARTFEA
ncbi:MAG: SOUL family heme-binding protein [Pseudomonadota bacterium]|uniref:SOUL family heme-binding protein n=1 Tax=Rhizorhabdus phycosphaerae TaxID=2711156 RepID=UPI0013EBFB7A|nr:heme-binding protein [Rhizorhabdus phycosphaerae]